MSSLDTLRGVLRRIDGRGYAAYRDLRGDYAEGPLTLFVDHVQRDPFAAPSKLRLRLSAAAAALPSELFETPVRRLALQDYLARQVRRAIGRECRGQRGSGKSGTVFIDSGGQEVLERSALRITEAWVEARISVGLPAAGRRVQGRQAETLLCDELKAVAMRALCWQSLEAEEARDFVACVERQEAIRAQLEERGLVAFVADGAVLPRASGAIDLPLGGEAVVPFRSPEALRVSLTLPPAPGAPAQATSQVLGMGVPEGVTLIIGGGYHGKSTLLKAVERGVYPHIPGDGRELVVSQQTAVKIRAEDGRRVERVDISSFISDLPYGRSTTAFCSEDASGSTSQAANILEALEVGARVLLIDEDTSATNFLVRDARMQALVQKQHEPITPLLDRVRELYDARGVSTLIVMGGCGDYFDVADTVVMMRDYLPQDATQAARDVAERLPSRRQAEVAAPFSEGRGRRPEASSFDASRGRREVKISARGLDLIRYGEHDLELRGLEQLVDVSQTRAIGLAIHLAAHRFMDGRRDMREVVEALEQCLDAEGLAVLAPFGRSGQHPGNLARPRRFELAAAINRLRSLRVCQP